MSVLIEPDKNQALILTLDNQLVQIFFFLKQLLDPIAVDLGNNDFADLGADFTE